VEQSPAVAKKNIVSENISVGLSPEAVREQASSDPVVQEVMRTFSAKIVDIRLK